jgi:transposase-like protein
MGLPLDELVCRGARQLLERAVEAEVEALLSEYASVTLLDGRRSVVRKGYFPEREVLTGIDPVAVQVPKVRDRSGAGVKFNSSLVPPYVRRTPRVSAAIPWLYLKGVSSGDLSEALAVLLGGGRQGDLAQCPEPVESAMVGGIPELGRPFAGEPTVCRLVGRRDRYRAA